PAVSSYSALLGAPRAEGLPPEGRDYRQRIRAAAARMDTLIEGLLQLSHAARAQLQREPVDLSLLAGWSLGEAQDAHPGVTVEASVQPDLAALGDERQLKQAFGHLLDNA